MSKHGAVKTEVGAAAAEVPSNKGKRGRKKKHPDGESEVKAENGALKQELITDHLPVVKKKRKINRFNGMPEEEVLLKLLPDRLAYGLDILIVGINPGLFAAYVGHHYAGPGNHFWKCLYLSGLVPEPMNCYDDIKLQQFGIGFTNICARTTRGSADLKRKEIEEGAEILKEKFREYKPKIAVFNGKGIYEVFSGNKKFVFGKQAGFIEGTSTMCYVMPSSSARCSQLPRAIDKVPFYEALRRLRDYAVGRIPHLDESEVTFPTLELKTAVKKEEPRETGETDDNAGNQNCDKKGAAASTPVKKAAAAKRANKGKGKKQEEEEGRERTDKLVKSEVNTDEINQATTTQADPPNQADGVNQSQAFSHVGNHAQPKLLSTTSHSLPNFLTPPLHQMSGMILPAPPGSNRIPGIPINPFPPAINFASLRSSYSSSSSSNPQGLSTQASQDFMSGFYSQPFGMVGQPTAVAFQSLDRGSGSMSGEHSSQREPVQIKSEPVDMSCQQ